MINLLNKVISDQRLIDLIRQMLQVRVFVSENLLFLPNHGIPQGNALFSILSNIYFNELDKFMEQIIKKYKKGSNPTHNPKFIELIKLSEYEKTLSSVFQNNIKRSRCKKLFNQGIKPYLYDNHYIRVRYIRYIDNILIGIKGPKSIAEKIKTEFQN